MTTTVPFGGWPSPLSARDIAAGVIGLQELREHDGALYWLESRPSEQGRTVLMVREADGSCRELTPAPYNVRSRVHEYGGAAYLPCAGGIFFVNFSDQRVYRIDAGQIVPVTDNTAERRFADFCWDSRHQRLIAVTEQHQPDQEPVNRLQALTLPADGGLATLTTLHEGHDFYAAPRLTPGGDRLAFLCWDHPNMPWDGSQLLQAAVNESGALGNATVIAGGATESVLQPEWQSDSALLFLSDANGYWNLHRYDASGVFCVLQDGADYGAPPWLLGMRHYAVVGPRHVLASRDGDGSELVLIDTESGFATPLSNGAEATSHGSLVKWGNSVCCIDGYAAKLPAIVSYPLDGSMATTLRTAGPPPLDSVMVSTAQKLRFPTRDRSTAFANFYLPCNPQCMPPAGSRPPLLVISHGGPTAAAATGLNLRIKYYTTRGWAVVDVDYRGSSGYGREYRNALNGKWGIVDVSDCEDAVRYLAEQGHIDAERVAICGGSAGGYTTLAALTLPTTTRRAFQAGASHYGIGDLRALARDTHKFESRYLHTVIGDDETALETRSPISHVDQLRCPVIFFQGSDDRVVPPNQSQSMVAALKEKGIPVAYLEFPGEGHGFRQADNIVRALEAEYQFFCRVFAIEPADPPITLEIDNL